MASLLIELQFWTFKDLLMKDVYCGVSKLHDKGEGDAFLENPYLEDHKSWSEDRDVVCIPRNKRPEKLKDTLKELEELLETDKCTTLKWIDAALFQLFLSSGILVTIFLSDNCNIKKVQIDRHLVGKLVSDHIVEVVIEDSHLLVSYVEPKLSYIYFGKQQASTSDRKYEKLGAMDPKIVTFDLIGPTSRHIERRLSSNSLHDAVLVWWHTDTQEAWPWSSLTSDRDRANILVYALNGPSLELMCFSHIDKSLLHACFRQHQSNYILTVEEETRRSKEVMVNVCTYEVSRTRFHQASVTSIPLEEHVLSAQWSPSEDKLLLSCSDRSLVIYDAYRHLTRITTLNFAVQQISWHPSGTLALVAGELGQLQCFDAALSCVNLEFVGEEAESSKVIEMSNFFRQKINLTFLAWQSWSGVEASKPTKSAITAVVALFEKGPLTIIKFPLGVLNVGKLTPFELITQYLKCKQVDEAVCLLLSLDWNRQGELCLKCLNCICNWLLRKPLNQDREVQLEAALGSFYGPNEPLSEVIILEYRDQVGHLARRFFHHLLRYQRFEKAFLLAVDLDCQDLFLDLHYVAEMKGQMALAEVALQHADRLDVGSVLTGSDTGESVSCDDETTEFSDCSSSDCQDDRNNNQHSTLEVTVPPSKAPCRSHPQSSYIGSPTQAFPTELCSPLVTTQRNPCLFVSPQTLTCQDLQAPTGTAEESLESSTSRRNFTHHIKQSPNIENKNPDTSVPTASAGFGLFSTTRTLTEQTTQPPVFRAPADSGPFHPTRTLTEQTPQSPASRTPADSGPFSPTKTLTQQASQSSISRALTDTGPLSPTRTLTEQTTQSSVSRAPEDFGPFSPKRILTEQAQQTLVYTASTGSEIFSPVKNLTQHAPQSSVSTGPEPFVPIRTVVQYPVQSPQFKNVITYKPMARTEHPQLPATVNPAQVCLASSVTTKTVLPQTHNLLASSFIEHSGNNQSFGLHQTRISAQVECSNALMGTKAIASLRQPQPYVNTRNTQVLLQPPHPTISHNVANSSWIGFQNTARSYNMNLRQGQPSHGHFNRTAIQREIRSQPLYRGIATCQMLTRSTWTPSQQHYLTSGGQPGAYQWPQCYSSGFTPARSVLVGPSSGHYPQSFYHPVWQDKQPLVHTGDGSGQNCGTSEGLSKLGNQQSHSPGYNYTCDPNEHFVGSDEIQTKQNSEEKTLDKNMQEDEQEHSEEEDLEGARVKFVHFGVV